MDHMVASIVGREIAEVFRKRRVPIGSVRLRVKRLNSAKGVFRDISLEFAGGEILGLYGFIGAGRSELAQALFGLHPLSAGEISIEGKTRRIRSPR
jgi:ABC-type sugar transport system ATPase subunit